MKIYWSIFARSDLPKRFIINCLFPCGTCQCHDKGNWTVQKHRRADVHNCSVTNWVVQIVGIPYYDEVYLQHVIYDWSDADEVLIKNNTFEVIKDIGQFPPKTKPITLEENINLNISGMIPPVRHKRVLLSLEIRHKGLAWIFFPKNSNLTINSSSS